jgi:hypothetical protein
VFLQRRGERLLNRRSIRDGIGKWDADLDDARAGGFERGDHGRGGSKIRVTRRHERHQTDIARRAQRVESFSDRYA